MKKIRSNKSLTWISDTEKKYISEVLGSGELTNFTGTLNTKDENILFNKSKDILSVRGNSYLGGDYVRRAEGLIAKLVSVDYAVMHNSATSCLFSAITALGLEKKSNIAVSGISFSATAASIVAAGMNPVMIDVDETLNMSPIALQQIIEKDKSIKAVLFVEWAGRSNNLLKIKEICTFEGIPMIEDSSQAVLSKIDGTNTFCGCVGDIGIFSLNGPKTFSIGEGGFSVTNNKFFAASMRLTRNHAEAYKVITRSPELNFADGFNFRPTEISAAIALAQLERRDQLKAIRQLNYKYLFDKLKDHFVIEDSVQMPDSPYSFVFSVKDPSLKQKVINFAQRNDISIFGGYPVEHWELYNQTELLSGCEKYRLNYLTIYQIGYPNNSNDMQIIVNILIKSLNF